MKYIGKLYGKVAGKTFDTGKTSKDWDDLELEIVDKRGEISLLETEINEQEKRILFLESENEKLTQSRDSWEEMQNTAMSEWRKCVDKLLEIEWISVNDRKKKQVKGGWYLVCDPNSLPNQCTYDLAFYSNWNGLWHTDSGDQIHPTHYMKLPKPPEK